MAEIDRIRWHCRRGMLELDIAIGGFFERHYTQLDEADQAAFVKLLEEKDQDIQSWLYDLEIPQDEDIKRIIALLKQHAAD